MLNSVPQSLVSPRYTTQVVLCNLTPKLSLVGEERCLQPVAGQKRDRGGVVGFPGSQAWGRRRRSIPKTYSGQPSSNCAEPHSDQSIIFPAHRESKINLNRCLKTHRLGFSKKARFRHRQHQAVVYFARPESCPYLRVTRQLLVSAEGICGEGHPAT